MKKTIFLEILLLFVFATLIYLSIYYWKYIFSMLKHISENTFGESAMKDLNATIKAHLPYAILSLVACVANLIAIILIALKDLPVFKPLLDKANARKQALKEEKKQKELEGKQQQLEKLQAEIDNLKNN